LSNKKIMIQDIIVITLITTALANIIYQVAKLIIRRKEDKLSCGGCGQCELKKSMLSEN